MSQHYLQHRAYRCALISEAIYDRRCLANFGLPEASDSQVKFLFGKSSQELFANCPSGFRGMLYHDTHDDSFILAFRGSKEPADWFANIKQYFGLTAPHYEKAKDIAKCYTGNGRLYFTGHSLGGGLATVAAIFSELKACVFNPPRIHEDTIAGFDISDCNRRVRRYVVKGEWLDHYGIFNKPFRIWTHEIGKKILLDVPVTWEPTFPIGVAIVCLLHIDHLFGGRVARPLRRLRIHLMDAVLEGLRRRFQSGQ